MASSQENLSMALFCDFENVALGVRDAKYEKFDIRPVLERLLLKGNIVVKKAYCDWERYKGFKAAMHEANFELIEIPHVRQSGKNSADIRLVVDALDLCYTKSHVNTFVIISGDSDFSPLVSKLRENAKQVIGVGVKQSTSDLLIANCDEFIFYDDLVREHQHAAARHETREAQQAPRRSPDDEARRKDEQEARKGKAIAIAVQTFDALASERGDSGKVWASVLKEAIKRRKPDFNESYYGFRAFGNLLEEAQARGLLEVGRDEKSGTYVFRSSGAHTHAGARNDVFERPAPADAAGDPVAADEAGGKQDTRRKRGGRKTSNRQAQPAATQGSTSQGGLFQAPHAATPRVDDDRADAPQAVASQSDIRQAVASPEADSQAAPLPAASAAPAGRRTRTPRKRSSQSAAEQPAQAAPAPAVARPTMAEPSAVDSTATGSTAAKSARKTAPRARRARKTTVATGND